MNIRITSINSRHYKIKRVAECDFCNSKEGKPRPVGQFIVKLQPVELDGVTKQVCQVCLRKHYRIKTVYRRKLDAKKAEF